MEAVKTTMEGATSIKTKDIKAFGTEAPEAPLKQMNIKRREVLPHDVEMEILYCGICHSDLHQIRMQMKWTMKLHERMNRRKAQRCHEKALLPSLPQSLRTQTNGKTKILGLVNLIKHSRYWKKKM